MRQNVHFAGRRFRLRAPGYRNDGHQIAGPPLRRRTSRHQATTISGASDQCDRIAAIGCGGVVVRHAAHLTGIDVGLGGVTGFDLRAVQSIVAKVIVVVVHIHGRTADAMLMRYHLAQMAAARFRLCRHLDQHVLVLVLTVGVRWRLLLLLRRIRDRCAGSERSLEVGAGRLVGIVD